jgi:hypothetical protein
MISGSGFAASQSFSVTIDGADFGHSMTDASGAFASRLQPGGLGAGMPQRVAHLLVTQGSVAVATRFTVTRSAGAQLTASGGAARTLAARFIVWGFARDGRSRRVYLHYVEPGGTARQSVRLGRTAGQCGFLRTQRRRVFPFEPGAGRWILQLDTDRVYMRRPRGPFARISVAVRTAAHPAGDLRLRGTSTHL